MMGWGPFLDKERVLTTPRLAQRKPEGAPEGPQAPAAGCACTGEQHPADSPDREGLEAALPRLSAARGPDQERECSSGDVGAAFASMLAAALGAAGGAAAATLHLGRSRQQGGGGSGGGSGGHGRGSNGLVADARLRFGAALAGGGGLRV